MMTIFINRIWCVKVDPFVGSWWKRRETETSTTKTSTNRNTGIPKCRQTKTSTYQNLNRPKRRQTETSTDQNVDRPTRRQTKANQNVEISKHRPTKNVDIQNVDRPKRGQYNLVHCIVVYLFSKFLGYICMAGGMYFMYQYPQLYNYWGSLYISVPAKLNLFLLGGTPGIISKVKDHFERLTINTDVCTEVVQMCE